VRTAIIDVLAGDEMNGYQLIQEIAERTGGAWKPSPGSVYPTVQQLEDEGLVEGREVDGRRLLRLTDAGRTYVEEHADEMAATWAGFEAPGDADERGEGDEPFGFGDRGPRGPGGRRADEGPGGDGLMPAVGQVMGAMWQIVTTGTAGQRAETVEILNETRRKLYRLLADHDSTDDTD
jgi:DNA-binding PadR family transcriptional regulator